MLLKRFSALVLLLCAFFSAQLLAQRVAIFDGKLFTWHPGQPDIITSNFNDKPATNWSLTVYNGGYHSSYCRVSSATIKINDVVVADGSNIDLQTYKFSTPVTIQSSNVLSVELAHDEDCVLELYLVGVGITQQLSITSSPSLQAVVDQTYNYTVETSPLLDWNNASITLNNAPSEMTINANNLSWVPSSSDIGEQTVSLTVNSSQYGNAQQTFTVGVVGNNQPPTVSDVTVQTAEDTAVTESFFASDQDGDSLTYEIVNPAQSGSVALNGADFIYTPANNYVGTDTFSYRAFDGELYSTEATVTITINAINDAPVITSTPLTAVNQLDNYQYAVIATDVDGDALSYQLVTAPTNASISSTGVIDWYAATVETVNFIVQVEDQNGGVITQNFSVDVVDVNEPPVITSSPVTLINERSIYEYAVNASDPDANDSLVFELEQGPFGMEIDPTNGLITWSTDSSSIGDHQVIVRVIDAAGLSDGQSYTLTIDDIDDAPVITSSPLLEGIEDTLYQYTVVVSDDDLNDSFSFLLLNAPNGMSIDAAGVVEWSPTQTDVGEHSVQIQVTDSRNLTVEQSYLLTIVNVNDSPQVISSPITTAQETIAYQYTLEVSDDDDSSWQFALASAPNGMTISAMGVINWSPVRGDAGSYPISITVSDLSGESVLHSYTLVVSEAPNEAPVVSDQSLVTAEDTALAVNLTASDADNDVVTFEVLSNPNSGSAQVSGQQLTYTPNANFFGSDQIVIRGFDGEAYSANATLSISVTPVNDLPFINNASLTTNEDQSTQVTVNAIDVDGDALQLEIIGTSSLGQVTASYPNISFTPNSNVFGNESLTIRVSDGFGYSNDAELSINVTAINDAPTAENVNLETSYQTAGSVLVNATDIESDPLTIQIISAPQNGSLTNSGLTFNYQPNNGFFGNDTASFRISDGLSLSPVYTLTINVAEPNNNPPTITSIPNTQVNVGDVFSYTLEASDPDGDVLTYSATSAPAGLQIDSQSGLVNWTADPQYELGLQTTNSACIVSEQTIDQKPVAMDTVYLIDATSSMMEVWPLITPHLVSSDTALINSAIGSGEIKNRYGLIGYAVSSIVISFDQQIWTDFPSLHNYLYIPDGPGGNSGDGENGLLAIQTALDTYSFRDNVARTITLFADDRTHAGLTNGETLEELRQRLIDNNIKLNVITYFTPYCADGRRAIGTDSLYLGYVATANGGFERCELDVGRTIEIGQPAIDSYIEPFVKTAIATGGSAFSLSSYYLEGNFDSVVAAYNYDLNKQASTTASGPQADLSISSAQITNGSQQPQLNIMIQNRGLASSQASVVELSGPVSSSTQVESIAAGESRIVTFSLPSFDLAGNVQISIESAGNECLSSNNQLTLPVVSLLVDDGNGGQDRQLFSVDVVSTERVAEIVSTPPTELSVGLDLDYQVELQNVAKGDLYQFTLEGPVNAYISRFSGLVRFSPTLEQIGSHDFVITATNIAGEQIEQRFQLQVVDDYTLPRFLDSSFEQRVIVGSMFEFTPTVESDADAELTFSFIHNPNQATIDPTTGAFTWVAMENDINVIRLVNIKVSDQYGNADYLAFNLYGDYLNVAPEVVDSGEDLATMGSVRYQNIFSITDPNVREDFNLAINTSAPNLTGTVYNYWGLDQRTGILSWEREDLNSSHPKHLDIVNHSCIASSNELSKNGVPWRQIQRFNVGGWMSPLVLPISDSNGDGLINGNDQRGLIVHTSSTIRGISMDNSIEHWRMQFGAGNLSSPPDRLHNIAAADVNLDGVLDVIYVRSGSNKALVARSSDDGRMLWETTEEISRQSSSFGDISIVDVNNDGVPEITAGDSVFSNQGSLLLSFDISNYSGTRFSPIYAHDFNGDGIQDFIQRGVVKDLAGNELYRVDLGRQESSKEAYIALANFDNDPALEIVFVENIDSNVHARTISLLDDDFSYIWGPKPIDNIGPVFVGDFTGDLQNEIFVSGLDALFDAKGSQLWHMDQWSGLDGRLASVADIQGDGRLDIVLHRAGFNYVIDGLTGSIMNRKNIGVASNVSPILVDSNFDKRFEMITIARGSLVNLEYSGTTLQENLPNLYSQDHRAAATLMDDFSVVKRASVQSDNSFGIAHVKSATFSDGIADLWVGRPISRERGNINVQVKNIGTADYPFAFNVLIVKGDPENGGEVVASQSSTSLAIGESQEIIFSNVELNDYNGEVSAVIQSLSVYQECTLGNNYTTAHTLEYSITDHDGESGSVYYLLGVEYGRASTRSLNGPSNRSLVEGEAYQEQIISVSGAAVDPLNVGSFQVHGGPDGLKIDEHSGVLSWMPSLGQAGTYSIQVDHINQVNQSTAYFSLTVAPSPNNAPVITSVPTVGSAITNTFIYQVEATDPDGDVITYRLLEAPNSMSINPTTGYIEWIADQEGRLTVSIEASDGQFSDVQTFFMDVSLSNSSPIITSTPLSKVVANQLYQYQIEATDNESDVISYSLVSGPAAMTVDSSTGLLRWAADSQDIGLHNVVIAATDEHGFSSNQSFSVTVLSGIANTAPSITSTPQGVIAPEQSYTYDVIAVDNEGHELSFSLITAPQGMVIDSTGSLMWTPETSDVGVYDIVIQVQDELGAYAQQSYSLMVSTDGQSNQLPTISSMPFTLAQTGVEYQYTIAATDPNGDALTYQLIAAPSSMILSDNVIRWIPSEEGKVNVQLRVSDGINYVEQRWTITVTNEAVSFSAVMNITPVVADPNEVITLQLIPQYARGPVAGTVTVAGVDYPLDSNLSTQLSLANVGAFNVTANITDGTTNLTLQDTLYIRDINDTSAPVVSIDSPDDAQVVTRLQDVAISVNDDCLANWRLILKARNSASNDFTILAEGTDNLTNQVVAQIDATLMLNGFYSLILQATDQNGLEASTNLVVSVEEQLKLGVYTITLEDVNIPVAGIPIQVTRTYDSRRRNETLDFGKGWSIDYQNVRVQENQTLGFAWTLNEYSSGYFSRWCVEPISNPMVSVRLPNGDVEKFKAVANPGCTQFVPEVNVELSFEPVGATFSTLEQDTYSLLRLVNGHLVRAGDNGQVDPALYTLTTKEGVKYKLDQNFGVTKIIEPNGNSLTYSDSGITHSLNKDIDFIRNDDGLITALVLPDDTQVRYSYNDQLELIRVEYPTGVSNEYTYLADHYLEELLDGEGRVVSRNEYDNDGRLIATYDAFGNKIEMIHDLANNTETVLDRNLNPTTYVYDDKGRVLSETNALNQTTYRTYNEHGLVLSETNPLTETTYWTYDERGNMLSEEDPSGYTIFYSYDNKNQLLEMYDSNGKVLAENRYDIGRNLTELTRADGSSISMLYDVGIGTNQTGELLLMTDAEGNSTEYHVHWFTGQTVGQTDAEGVRTDFELDTNLNRTKERTTRTLADGSTEILETEYVYVNNRLEQTTYPDGTTSRVEYDENGREAVIYDSQNRPTRMDYNERGELVLTTYHDGTTVSAEYDANGNKRFETDRRGFTTEYIYDALNRVEVTITPDGARTVNEYDEAGRLKAVTDGRGYRTEYEYDDLGRRDKVINAYNQEHSFDYDSEGNLISETDARGHTTRYEYDELNRRKATIFHNLSQVSTEYDGADRQVAKLDQALIRTQFEYDKMGRLLKVIDVQGNETSYTYDEQGNKLTQTDSEQRTTRWTYDSMGRVLSRQLPMGQIERTEYDAFGRLERHTDFNGDTTVYGYNNRDQIDTITYADGRVESFTYDAVGNRLTATNADGTTSYEYDSMGRLETETKPSGEVLAYEYDENGNKTLFTITYVDGTVRTERFSYDRLNRLETVTDNNGNVTTYGYDEVGNRDSISYPNGTSHVYVYDELNRLTTLRHFDVNGALLNEFNYTLHATGRRERIDELSGRSVINGYDNLYRLTSETIVDPINGDYSASYVYDTVGNRTYSTINGVETAYTYDDNDRLTQEGGERYTYDANGNTLTKTLDEDVSTFAYDKKNRLTSAVLSENGVLSSFTYRYNTDGIRVAKAQEGVETRFIIDSNQAYAQVVAEVDNSNVTPKEYLYGDDLISQQQNAEQHYFMYDGLGSTRSLSDAAGTISDEYFYDAFGITLAQTGSTNNDYLYTGEQYDAGLDNYYLRARYYDQNVGRFTQMDTWMGKMCSTITLNKYIYGGSDPVNYTDPSGNMFIGANLVNVSFSQFVQVWGNSKKAKKRYDTYQAIRKTLCRPAKSISKYVDKAFHKHHARPKYMDGPDIDANLVEIADTLHRRLHQVVNILYSLNGVKAYNGTAYNGLSDKDKKFALKILYETMKAFDRSCSTVRGYKPIAPVLEKFL